MAYRRSVTSSKNNDNEILKIINKLNGEGRKFNMQISYLALVPTPPSKTSYILCFILISAYLITL